MISLLHRSLFVFAIFLTSQFLKSCSGPAVILPTTEVETVRMVPWSSQHLDAFQGLNQTALLDEGSFLIISRQGDDEYSLERYTSELELEWTTPIDFIGGEIFPMIFNHGNRTLLITQIDLDEDRTVVRMRNVNVDGSLSHPETILHSPRDFKRRYFPVVSPDRSHVLFYGISEPIEVEDGTGHDVPAEVQGTTLIRISDGSYKSTFDTVLYHDDYDDTRHIAGAVTDDGHGTIMEVITSSVDGNRLEMLVHRVRDGIRTMDRYSLPNRTSDLDGEASEDEIYRPNSLIVTATERGTVRSSYLLHSAGTVDYLASAELDVKTGTFRFLPPHNLSSEDVRNMTRGAVDRLSEFTRLENVIPHEDGTTTYLFEKKLRGSSMYGTRPRESDVVLNYEHIISLHLSPTGSILSTAYIDRDEIWNPHWKAYMEGSHSWFLDGNHLHVMVREREKKGVILYTVDLSTGAITTRQMLLLGTEAYVSRHLTIWDRGSAVILFVKDGTWGSVWKIVRQKL